jgi:hypothetical protein
VLRLLLMEAVATVAAGTWHPHPLWRWVGSAHHLLLLQLLLAAAALQLRLLLLLLGTVPLT